MTNTYSRRLVLAGLLGMAAPAAAVPRLRLTLPAPTGPHRVGRASLHLVDHARQDPWWSTPHPRELMVSLWSPTTKAGRRGPWVGTIDPVRAIAAERAYLRAFFDQHLRGRENHLLDGPSATYPEAVFY